MKRVEDSTGARSELAGITRSLNELIRARLGIESTGDVSEADPVWGEGGSIAREAARVTREAERMIRQCGPVMPEAGAAERRAGTAVLDGETLESLRETVAGCKRCPLHKTRKNVVFGAGTGETKILFVGEAPGREEDLQGLPFVGRAGQLLTKIIEAIEFKREDVYIANVLKCRPPENRNPAPEEVARCRPYLFKQIELLKPKVICTMGVFATQTLLDTKSPLTVLRGQVHKVNGVAVIPTYHPAACLRYPKFKASVWEDVQLLRKEYLS